MRRDHEVFREAVERAVRGRLRPATGDARDTDAAVAAVHVLIELIDPAEAISARAWRSADAQRGAEPKPG